MSLVEIACDGRVARIALNRPEKRNALNADLCHELATAVDDATRDAGIGAILLTGNGPAFCAGMDLTELGEATSTDRIDQAQEQLFTMGSRATKPIVAAVDGPALAGGTGLVANCHIVVASEKATFGLTEIRLGLWPFLIYRPVVAAIGERKALELALSGRIFDAFEAKNLGFCHEICPNPTEKALETAKVLASWSPSAVRSGMMFVEEVRDREARDAADFARLIRKEIFEGEDFREGLAAFREKRRPRWPSLEGVADHT